MCNVLQVSNLCIVLTHQGIEAISTIITSTPTTPSYMIGMRENKVTREPLMEAVKLTWDIAAAIQEKDFKKAMELRDPEFEPAFRYAYFTYVDFFNFWY